MLFSKHVIMSCCFIFLTPCSSISEQEVFKSVRGKVMKFLKVLWPLRILQYSIASYMMLSYSIL